MSFCQTGNRKKFKIKKIKMNPKIAIKTDHHFDQTDTGRFSVFLIYSDEETDSQAIRLWNAEVFFWEKVISYL